MGLCMHFSVLASSETPIPTAVTSYVKSHFPKAKNVHWQKHGEDYIAHFVNVKSEVGLCLNEKGELLDRVTEITLKDELPEAVKRNFAVDHLLYAEKFEGRNGELFYILEIKLNESESDEIIYDREGNQVKEIVFNDAKGGEKPSVLEF